MNIEIIVILLLIIVNLGLTLVSTRVIARSVLSMDESLARAIQTTIENLPEALRAQYLSDVEPPNPFQALIAKFFEDKIGDLGKPQEVIEIKKGKDGKFSN
jgi:uncharacterized protein with von Willebrand factor type A (vWA) domain